jgi:HEPN domain-containing protein
MSALHEAWVRMAEEDCYLAEAVDPQRAPRGVCFHAQQCIEKYLKAAPAQHGLEAERTHDLETLGERLAELDSGFLVLLDRLELLNPHAVLTRYSFAGPTPTEAEQALGTMRELRTAVRSLMGLNPTTGQADAWWAPEERPQ